MSQRAVLFMINRRSRRILLIISTHDDTDISLFDTKRLKSNPVQNLHIVISSPSLARGQSPLSTSALRRHPVKAVWLFFFTPERRSLYLPRAKTSNGLSIIQYGTSISRVRCDKTQWHISLHIRDGDKERKKACSFWHGMLRARLRPDSWRDVSGSDVFWQPRLSYEVDIRAKGSTSGKGLTFIAHHPSTVLSPPRALPSSCLRAMKQRSPFVWTL